jgi:predicted Zn-dependent protease
MTNKENVELARWAVGLARKQGANEASANLFSNRSIDVEVRAGKLEKLQEAGRHGLSLSVYLDHRFASHSTNDLRRDALAGFVSEAVAMTKHLAPDPYRTLPDPKYYKGQEKKELNLLDPAYERLDTAERIRLAKAIDQIALTYDFKAKPKGADIFDASFMPPAASLKVN